MPLIGALLSKAVIDQWSWGAILGFIVAGFSAHFLSQRRELRSTEESPEAIKAQAAQLHSELRAQVQSRSFGARSKLIAAPLTELDLDVEPRVGLVRDPRLTKPDPISEKKTDIVTAFTSSKRRVLIVGEPGSGKITAAYALIEQLDETEGNERVPLLVNLSAWEAQENFETFLVDYLLSVVGYQVRERTVASAFISSDRYSLILDGLDEIPAKLRRHFCERLDEFVRGLPSEVAVVVTCRTQEYEELFATHPMGLGLVQAVEILPLTSQQLDSAFVELARFDDRDWESLLTQRHLLACQRARDLLSNPLFLNLAIASRLRPRELLSCDEARELRDLVLERYLDRAVADQSENEPQDVRRYLSWIARFLSGDEVSPFGLKTTDATVFDLADLTPPEPPRWYPLFSGLAGGLVSGLVTGLGFGLLSGRLSAMLIMGVLIGLLHGLLVGIFTVCPNRRSAVSSRLTLVLPSTEQQLLALLRRAGLGLFRALGYGLYKGLVVGLIVAMGFGLLAGLSSGLEMGLGGLLIGLVLWLIVGVVLGLGRLIERLGETQSFLITARTPKETRSRSLIAALTWLVGGLVVGLVFGLVGWIEARGLEAEGLEGRLLGGLFLGLVLGWASGWASGCAMVVGSCCCRRSLTGASLGLATSLRVRPTFWNGVPSDRSFAG